jgi:hypothetical protein
LNSSIPIARFVIHSGYYMVVPSRLPCGMRARRLCGGETDRPMKRRILDNKAPLTFEGFLLVHFPVLYTSLPSVRKWPDSLTIRVARVPEGRRLDQGAAGLDSRTISLPVGDRSWLLERLRARRWMEEGNVRPGWTKESASDTNPILCKITIHSLSIR